MSSSFVVLLFVLFDGNEKILNQAQALAVPDHENQMEKFKNFVCKCWIRGKMESKQPAVSIRS